MDSLQYPKGAFIFLAGDPAERVFLIRSGKIELVKGQEASSAPLAELGAGEIFGEISLLEQRPRSLSARAKTAVEISGLTLDEFENFLLRDAEALQHYLKALYARTRRLASPIDPQASEGMLSTHRYSVVLHPLTRRAAATLPPEGLVVPKFPFCIGRAADDHEQIPSNTNDLWLNDHPPYNISRNHATIDIEAGEVVIRDRGSSLGLFVNELQVGGKSKLRQVPLEHGDNVVILGGRMSPYHFRVEVTS
ncbi:MAG: cyclic nucleotide-binding domain-containing protein [Planctomycetes bacterium]|nr:cyclic nucleotide-binding domain-containing protein [Planctomycetota bacterium]